MATPSSRVILVTGANRGIGNGIVQRLAAQAPPDTNNIIHDGDDKSTGKWTIILACRTKKSAEEAIEQLRRENKAGNAILEAAELELSSDQSISAAKKDIEERFGRVDVLINNAGMVERINEERSNVRAHFVETYSNNVGAVVIVTEEFLPLLRKSSDPRIINLSSQTGSLQHAATTPHFLTDQRGYSIAKAALNRLTIDYSKLFPEVTFYCACPGYCKTFLNLYQGFKDPVEGARIVEELVVAEKGKYAFGFYAFEDGKVLNYEW